MNNLQECSKGEIPLESVLSTGELNSRPSRPPDYETEHRALLAIAKHMAASPRTTLQKLVEVALEVCRAGSAGVSLLSEETGDFYWPAIAGGGRTSVAGRRVTSDPAASSSTETRCNCSHTLNVITPIWFQSRRR